jgi:hypothetical protein
MVGLRTTGATAQQVAEQVTHVEKSLQEVPHADKIRIFQARRVANHFSGQGQAPSRVLMANTCVGARKKDRRHPAAINRRAIFRARQR